MNKVDFKKKYKDLYSPSSKEAVLVTVPPMQFLIVDGGGDPNGPEFQQAVGALYGLSYTIKFWPKKHAPPKGYFEYTIPPLEGLWWVKGVDGPMSMNTPMDKWRWQAMIMQPDFVTQELLKDAKAELSAKKPNPKISSVRLETFDEGKSVQIMHIGPYGEEGPDIQKLDSYMKAHDLASNGKHHELYFGDPRRTKPENLRTILRHPVKSVK